MWKSVKDGERRLMTKGSSITCSEKRKSESEVFLLLNRTRTDTKKTPATHGKQIKGEDYRCMVRNCDAALVWRPVYDVAVEGLPIVHTHVVETWAKGGKM